MYKTLIGILVAIALTLVISFLTFSAAQERPADFTFNNGTEPKSLDPHIMTGQPEGRIADAIFEGLTYRDPKSLLPVPGAAKRWEISPDGLTYRFYMRENATWTDGKPVTAADVAWSWRRLQKPETASEYAYILHMIKGAEAYNTYGSAAKHLRERVRLGLKLARMASPPSDQSLGDHTLAHLAKNLADFTVALSAAQKGAKRGNEDHVAQLAALERIVADARGGIAIDAWPTLLDGLHVNAVVKGTKNEVIRNAIDRREGDLSPEELDEIEKALAAEADARQKAWDHANEHFGIDEGVYVDPDDDSVLVVELRAPTPYFLELTAFYPVYPVPRHVVEKHESNWFLPDKIVSNGPFRLADWRINDRIRLEKRDDYWNKDAIKIDVADAVPFENAMTALNMFLTGDLDWTQSPPNEVVDTLKPLPTYRSASGWVVYYYRFNCTHPVLRKPKVRKAISIAFDRKAITKSILRAGQPPAYLLVPPGIPTYEQPESALGYRVEEAKRLLAEAGHPGGEGIGELRLLHNTDQSHQKIAEAISDQLRAIGITVKPINKEWQAYQQSTRELDYELARAGWIGDYMDPNTFLDMWVTNGGNNQTGWSEPKYDRLIQMASDVFSAVADPDAWIEDLKEPERARSYLREINEATDADARREAAEKLRLHFFREAEAILFQDAFPIIPIYFYVVQSMVQDWVKGWYSELEMPDGKRVPNAKDIHPLRGISIDVERKREGV